MKRTIVISAIALSAIALSFLAPFSAFAQDPLNYYALKAGAYVPTGDLEDVGLDTGFSGSFVLGRHLGPNVAAELGIGYLESEGGDFRTIPVELTGKLTYPMDTVELYVGAGGGVYFATFDGDLSLPIVGTTTFDDNDTVFGGHVVIGGTSDITPNLFFGVEGKYIFTDRVDVQGRAGAVPVELSANLDGYIVTVSIGYRF
jgi:opacity protein-like surface antigen